MNYSARSLKYQLLSDHDATQAIRVDQNLCDNYSWSVIVLPNGVDGNPTVNIDKKNDDSESWTKYKCDPQELLDAVNGDGVTFKDSIVPHDTISLNYIPTDVTGGTVDAWLLLKKVN